MRTGVDINTLKHEVMEIHDAYPVWTLDNAFVHWFLQALLLDDTDAAAKCVTGVSHDKGIDGLFIDDSIEKVFVLQGKFHQGQHAPLESRSDIITFAQIARKIASPHVEFHTYIDRIDPPIRERLVQASKKNPEASLCASAILLHDWARERVTQIRGRIGGISSE